MANSLLDFVMALVRDPDAAARYAADPAQAIADADLGSVTSTDVQNLIPVVAESLSMSVPAHGLDVFGAEPQANVWATGAATAAFDAFDVQVPATVVADSTPFAPAVVEDIEPEGAVPTALDLVEPAVSVQMDDPAVLDDVPSTGVGLGAEWDTHLVDTDPGDLPSSFDLFD